MLDVDGGIDVDAALEQLLDIQVALGMPAARRVGVGELVDQHDLRPARDDGVEVHLLEPLAAVLDAPARNDLEPFQQRFGFLAAVRLDDADHNVVAVLAPGARRLQHGVGLADAGRGADEDPQLAGAAFLAPGGFEQGLRRGPLVALLICHRPLCAAAPQRSVSVYLSGCAVQRHVERQHVDPRLAKQAEQTPLDVVVDQLRERDLPAYCAPWQRAAPGTAPPPE